MTATFEHAKPGACAACNVAPAAEHLAELPKDATLMLSLPGIHCAGCISGVEKALKAFPGVRSARVNLTLRRAAVEAAPDVTAQDLTQLLERAGYEAHELDPGVLATTEADRQGRDLLMRLAVAFFAMMNVMLLSVAVWAGAEGVTRDMMHWISAAIAIPAVVFSGRPFYVSAWGALRGGRLNMDVPITLAIVLAVGDIVRVKPGGRIPVDGIVTEGQSELDRSLMTGESLPVYAGPGTEVSAGEVNLTGPLMVEVRAAGRDTSLHRIADLVAVAESGRANYNSLADQAAKLYAPGVHILAVVAAVGWWIYTQDLRISLNIAAAVLIITCPCALGLAVPAVTTAASGRLFRKGLLIKDGTALERMSEGDTVVFDKTGTLTTGAPEPVGLDSHPDEAMGVALALAEASSHPLAEALSGALRARGLRAARIEGATEVPGYGVEGIWRGKPVRLGRAAWVGAEAPDVTATFLSLGGEPPRAIRFTDTARGRGRNGRRAQ